MPPGRDRQQTLFDEPETAAERVKQTTGATRVRFDGDVYVPKRDDERLSTQMLRLVAATRDQRFRTLGELSQITGDPEASISAQLRHLRKERFGSHTVNRRQRGGSGDLYEYQVLLKRGDQ